MHLSRGLIPFQSASKLRKYGIQNLVPDLCKHGRENGRHVPDRINMGAKCNHVPECTNYGLEHVKHVPEHSNMGVRTLNMFPIAQTRKYGRENTNMLPSPQIMGANAKS